MGNIIEIAGGKISEIVSKDIENNAGSFINNVASKFVKQKGDEQGVTYNTPPSDERKVKNSIKGFAIFRRKDNYNNKPDFGFDWYAGRNYGTTYSEPFNFDDDKILLSGKNKLKAEYSSIIKYIPVRENGYINAGKNGGNSLISINGQEYFVPWFSGFAKDESGNPKSYNLDVFFYIEDPSEGKIHINCETKNIEVEFTDEGGNSFEVSKSTEKQFTKTVRITFLDYITDHSSIIITFHKKSEEEKEEEKKRQEEIANGKPPQSVQTVYISPGELLGIMNVYKNSVEYDLVVRYVKVFFKGWMYVDSYDDKMYLSGASSGYIENKKLLEKEQNLTKGIANLRALQSSTQTIVNTVRTKEIEDLITKQEKKLQDIKNLSLKRQIISTDLYKEQVQAMNNYTSLIDQIKPKIIDTFSQSLIHYKEKDIASYEQIEIDVEKMDSFFDDLKLTKIGHVHYIVNDKNEEANSTRINSKINNAFESNETKDKKELIMFLIPFGIRSDIKKNLILGGEAEDVSYEADTAMLTPQAGMSTFIHEAGHTFSLPHTFLKRDGSWVTEGIKITQGTTDNIMDYNHNPINQDKNPENDVPIIKDKIALWKFQWDIMSKDPNLIELVKK